MPRQDFETAMETRAYREKMRHKKRVRQCLEHMTQYKMTLKDLIDGMIEAEGIIGVGLISLRDALCDVVNEHLGRPATEKAMQEAIPTLISGPVYPAYLIPARRGREIGLKCIVCDAPVNQLDRPDREAKLCSDCFESEKRAHD